MSEELAIYQNQSPIPAQASNDAQVIEMWLHEKPVNTVKAYLIDMKKFFDFCNGIPIKKVTLKMLQGFENSLKERGLKPSTSTRHMSTVKSLFTFAWRIGYVQFNPGAVIKLRRPKDTLAQRLLDRSTVIKMIEREKNPRNSALMRLMYVSGIRSTEAINLKGCDLLKHEIGGQITVVAKGNKTLAIWVDEKTYSQIVDLGAGQNENVFRTKTGSPIHINHILKIVRAAAKRVGVQKNVSPHWLRHATATHLMDAGVGIMEIKTHLGHDSLQSTTRYLHVKPSASSAKLLAW